ncbi:MAG: 2-dehydro-3-deoxygluconokinase [Tenericutes bacterium ADurb.Bin239]|nr:MAG: 2-dehydro-3-deoxygluconokinase [Tenericutes bacterium ADurb.Bin239]
MIVLETLNKIAKCLLFYFLLSFRYDNCMVITIGEILVDIFKSNHDEKVLPGGAPFNVACNIAHFGGEVRFIGSVGNDKYGKMLTAFAESRLFQSVLIRTLKDKITTQAIVTLKNGERTFKFNRLNGADYHFDLDPVRKIEMTGNTIVHLGSLMLSEKEGQDFALEVVNIVKRRGAKLSFDLNYREDIFGNMSDFMPVFSKIIKEADIVKFSEEEILAYTRQIEVESAILTFNNPRQIVIVTLGERGALYRYKGRLIEVPSKKVKAVDTTGAGDAFYSFVLYAISKMEQFDFTHQALSDIIYYANLVGGAATLKQGAIGAVPTLNEIKSWGYTEGEG